MMSDMYILCSIKPIKFLYVTHSNCNPHIINGAYEKIKVEKFELEQHSSGFDPVPLCSYHYSNCTKNAFEDIKKNKNIMQLEMITDHSPLYGVPSNSIEELIENNIELFL